MRESNSRPLAPKARIIPLDQSPCFVTLLVRGRRQAHNPTLAKILRLTYNRSCSHNRPQTAACNAVYSISRRASLITRLGEQLPRPRQVSMTIMDPLIQFMSCGGLISYGPPKTKKCILRGSNPRGLSPLGLKSSALTTRPRMLTMKGTVSEWLRSWF